MCKPKTSIPDISGSVEGFMEKTDWPGASQSHSNCFSTGNRKVMRGRFGTVMLSRYRLAGNRERRPRRQKPSFAGGDGKAF